MTEDDAKTKICPFTFAQPAHYAPDGGGIRDAGPWPCIASACMAWRWRDTLRQAADNTHISAANGPGAAERIQRNRRGYCGLAGAPR